MPSYANKKEAREVAQSVRKRLANPKRWNIRVHENMGWHWTLECGTVSLHGYRFPGKPMTFSCLVSSEPEKPLGGLAAWSPPKDRNFDDPQLAVNYAVGHAAKYVRGLMNAVANASLAVNDPEVF